MPKISVVLPVYNGEPYLAAAIESILGQSFTDFELIIINDGSTDKSQQTIERFTDKRIRAYQQKNSGLAATLNYGISLAGGEYIARHDQDDLALPERLARQVSYLESHKKCGLVGTWASVLEEKGPTYRYLKHPADNGTLQFLLLFDNPFVHSSVMFRKSVVDSLGGYTTNPKRQPPEDYELWSRVARSSQVANIPEFLQQYRATSGSMSRGEKDPFTEKVIERSKENIAHLIDRQDAGIDELAVLAHRSLAENEASQPINKLEKLLNEIYKKVEAMPDTDQRTLKREAKRISQHIRCNYPASPVRHYYYCLVRRIYHIVNRFSRNGV